MNMLAWHEFVLRLGAAVLGGALIGFERRWRSRGAGLRTNTLVAAGAAMFVLISHMTPSGTNPTQVTAYVVSGVGFLGAGVIISDGVSVRGINTAATLWCAAAVGALAASGFIWQAGVATAAILAINILLRPLRPATHRRGHRDRNDLPLPRHHPRQERSPHPRAPTTKHLRPRLPAPRLGERQHRRHRPSRSQSRARHHRPQRRADRSSRRQARTRAQRHVGPVACDRTRRPHPIQRRQHTRRLIDH